MPDYSYTTMSLQTIDTRKLKAPHMNSARSGIVEAWKLCYHLMHGACGLSKFAQRTATIIGGAPGVSSCVTGTTSSKRSHVTPFEDVVAAKIKFRGRARLHVAISVHDHPCMFPGQHLVGDQYSNLSDPYSHQWLLFPVTYRPAGMLAPGLPCFAAHVHSHSLFPGGAKMGVQSLVHTSHDDSQRLKT
ncbi:hypothetical protein M8818_001054 [Zalaria obscura]|uniref:Uncharacterized protein n=1 Tax=Zalaria obscura TaxID=2024903 RepID=A0ACC3SLI2_9PEZI